VARAYVVLQLRSEAFDHYSCDRERFSMGLDLVAMAKAFSSADNNNDIITIKSLGGMIFEISLESPGKFAGHARTSFALADLLTDPVLILGLWTGSRVFRRFSLDFVGTDGVSVSVPQHPDSAYEAIVRMPSAKFMHFCNKLRSSGKLVHRFYPGGL
jgi:proliferating cell nuclear antigen